MIEITAEIRTIIDRAAADLSLAEDEYIDPADGLIHCKHCGGNRQTVVPCFGKSFFAGCIANALLDRDIPVLMTNFPSILNRLTGMFSEDRADFIASLGMYDLLIIDDLGVERNTEYAMEQMFHVIDCRYRSRKPMIITTNLKLEEIKNPPDLAHARIYDRILERCAPILFDGKNFREENAETTKAAAKGIISQK